MIDRGVEAPVPPRMVDQGGGPDRSGIVPPRLLRPFPPPVGGGIGGRPPPSGGGEI